MRGRSSSYNGRKQGECIVRTGLWSKIVVLRSDWYAYVFVVQSLVSERSKGTNWNCKSRQKSLLRTAASPLTVRTSQGKCFPKLKVGRMALLSSQETSQCARLFRQYQPSVADAKSNLKPFVNLRELATRAFSGAKLREDRSGKGTGSRCIRCCNSNIRQRAVRGG